MCNAIIQMSEDTKFRPFRRFDVILRVLVSFYLYIRTILIVGVRVLHDKRNPAGLAVGWLFKIKDLGQLLHFRSLLLRELPLWIG